MQLNLLPRVTYSFILGCPLQCIGKIRSVFAQVLLEHQGGVMLLKPSSRQCRRALCRRLWPSVAAPLPRFSKWVPCLSLASTAITGWYKVFRSTMCKWIALSPTRTSPCNVLKSTKYKWRSWSALTTIPPPPFLLPACPTQCKTWVNQPSGQCWFGDKISWYLKIYQ